MVIQSCYCGFCVLDNLDWGGDIWLQVVMDAAILFVRKKKETRRWFIVSLLMYQVVISGVVMKYNQVTKGKYNQIMKGMKLTHVNETTQTAKIRHYKIIMVCRTIVQMS